MPGCGYCGNSPAKRDVPPADQTRPDMHLSSPDSTRTLHVFERQTQTPRETEKGLFLFVIMRLQALGEPTTQGRATRKVVERAAKASLADCPPHRLTITCLQPAFFSTGHTTTLPSIQYSSLAQRSLEPWFVQTHAIRLRSPNGHRDHSPFVPWLRRYQSSTHRTNQPTNQPPTPALLFPRFQNFSTHIASALQTPETNILYCPFHHPYAPRSMQPPKPRSRHWKQRRAGNFVLTLVDRHGGRCLLFFPSGFLQSLLLSLHLRHTQQQKVSEKTFGTYMSALHAAAAVAFPAVTTTQTRARRRPSVAATHSAADMRSCT
ncbi:hypothetical protein HDK77DRAFT_280923 [Phyllosticta capitalensis]